MLLLLLACQEATLPTTEVSQPTAEVSQPALQAVLPRFSQGELAESDTAVAVQGVLVCTDSQGPWTLQVHADHPEFYGPKPGKLPWMQPEVEVQLDSAGPFELLVPTSQGRLFIAHQGIDRQAFADEAGALTELRGPVTDLILDCKHSPTWPGGQAPVTETGGAAPPPNTPDASMDWLYQAKSGSRNDRLELQRYEERKADYEHRFRGDPNAGDIAGSLAIMPPEMAAEAADNMEGR